MTSLFETFARSVANSLGALLRAHFEMVLSSMELLPVRDFLAGFSESGFTAFLNLEPVSSAAVLQVETALVFPIIDVLLGGFGTPATTTRELTEIDQEIMDSVTQILGRHLEETWQPTGVKVRLDHRQKATQIQSVYTPTEKLAVFTFEAKVNETAGAVILAFPASLASAMLRETTAGPHGKSRTSAGSQSTLSTRILDCQFDSTMGIPDLSFAFASWLTFVPEASLTCIARSSYPRR